MDFFSTVTEVHPSLDDSTGVHSKSISNDTLSRLAKTVSALNEDKKKRLHKVFLLYIAILFLSFFFLFENVFPISLLDTVLLEPLDIDK